MNSTQNSLLSYIKQMSEKIGVDKIAIFMIIINSFTWPIAFIYASQHKFDYGTALIVRGLSCYMSSYLICWIFGFTLDVKDSKSLKYLIIRNTIMSVHGIAYALSQFYIPVSLLHTIGISGVIFITFLDYLLNGTIINKSQLIGIIISIFGVLFVINGNSIMAMVDPQYKFQSDFQNYKTSQIWQITLVSVILLIVCLFWSYAVIVTKYVKLNPVVINFYVSLQLCFVGTISTSQTTSKDFNVSEYAWSYLFSGLLFAISHLTFITSIVIYKKNTGILMAILNNVVIVAYMISIFRYEQTINLFCVMGSFILIIGVSKILLSKHTPQIQQKLETKN